jgi:hypothetical protein
MDGEEYVVHSPADVEREAAKAKMRAAAWRTDYDIAEYAKVLEAVGLS